MDDKPDKSEKPEEQKPTTMRLSKEMLEDLKMIAQIDDTNVSALIREAVETLLVERRADAEFQTRLRERIRRDQKLLRRLS